MATALQLCTLNSWYFLAIFQQQRFSSSFLSLSISFGVCVFAIVLQSYLQNEEMEAVAIATEVERLLRLKG